VAEVSDFARETFVRTVAEPYRTKVVEMLRLPDRADRETILREAFYSPAYLNSSDVYIDFATDSGTSAMSDEQWAGLMRGDEAYVRSRNFFALEKSVQDILGFRHVVPTHQGRAAENILMELLVKEGDIVLSNTHFDTTKAHVENRKALPVDLVGDWLWQFREPQPFKGNVDLAKLEAALARYHERVPFVILTVLNNFACSSPVSMENIREVRRLASRYDIPIYFDIARFAENAYFIKTREVGYSEKTIPEIVGEMMSYGRGCWMSAKKDALVNIGGFIATDDEDLSRRCQERLVLYEGFPTYGGLARRDLEAMAIGLREGLDENYLGHRTRLVAYLGDLLEKVGWVVSKPIGGSGVFVDVEAMYPQLAPEQLPSITLCCDLYLEGGIRAGAAPFPMNTIDPKTGNIVERIFQFARLAVPRRVYSKAHMDFVGEIGARVAAGASKQRGYRAVFVPPVLGHFFAKFEPFESELRK
jgi:tryptophanase